jgi:hypothetical protein
MPPGIDGQLNGVPQGRELISHGLRPPFPPGNAFLQGRFQLVTVGIIAEDVERSLSMYGTQFQTGNDFQLITSGL